MQQYLPSGYANVRLMHDGIGALNIVGSAIGVATGVNGGQEIADTVASAWNDALLQGGARLNSGWTFTGTQVTVGDDDEEFQLFIGNLVVNGSNSQPCLPPNVAKLIRKRTALLGRKYRGRMFLPSGYLLDVEVGNGGLIDNAIIAGETLSLEDFFNELTIEGMPPVLIHQYGTYVDHNGVTRTVAPLAPTPIVALTPDALVSTQRRRLR